MRIISSLMLFFVSLFFSCRNSYKNVASLSDKEMAVLAEIKDRYQANDIKVSQADTFNTIIAKSISITIWNSKNTKLTDSSLNDHCEMIVKRFIKSYQPEKKYEFIKVNFAEGTSTFLYKNWKSSGQIYNAEYIKNVIDELNNPVYHLAELENNNAYDSIISYAEALIQTNKNVDVALSYQGLAYFKIHDTTDAIQNFEKARTLNREDIDIPMNLAIIIGSRNQYADALKYIDTVLTMQAEYPKAIYYRGLYSYYSGNKLKGCEDLSKAEKLGIAEATTFLNFNCK